MLKTRTCLAFALGLTATTALSPSFAEPVTVLHRFVNVAKGARPRAPLAADAQGNLYGTTYTGNANGNGTVFELSPPTGGGTRWTQTVLHGFSNNTKDGQFPYSGVTLDAKGNVFGTTSEGGINDAGVVYELLKPNDRTKGWALQILHRFTAGKDGGSSYSTLVFGPDGDLYGTTGYGGANSAGTVFKLTPQSGAPWKQTILYNFTNGADGGYPYCTLVFDKSGNIFGTTLNGGNAGNGVVFQLSPPQKGTLWTETVLHSFDNATDGSEPRTGVTLDAAGNLYGTTEVGGSAGYGAVFEVSPPAKQGGAWTESVLHSFTFSPDGGTPGASNLVLDKSGNLYGTTQTGGTLKMGVVFKLSTPAQNGGKWSETVLHAFKGAPDGSQPESGLLQTSAKTLVGTTLFGGTGNDFGLVYSIAP